MNIQTKPIASDYAYWKNALNGKFGPIHENDPQCGFYRMKGRGGDPDIPVAIWRGEDGQVIQKPADSWVWCCQKPIEDAVYYAVSEGSPWPDVLETEFDKAAGMGHNNPPDPESYEGIVAELNSCTEELKNLKPAESQLEADTIANLKDRVAALGRRAEKMRLVEVDPINRQKDAIQAKYNPIKDTAKKTVDALRGLLTPWLVKLDEKRKAEEAELARQKAEAERKKAEEERRRQEAEAGQVVIPELAPETPQEPAMKAKVITKAAVGTRGRKTALRTVYSAEITDLSAVVSHYAENPKVVEVVTALALADLRADKSVPGAELKIEKVAV